MHKLGRLKRTVKDMGELMNAVIKYDESDKTKDAKSEDDKDGQNKKERLQRIPEPAKQASS